MPDTLTHLVTRAQRGDQNAVADLYNLHHRMIFRYIWSKVSETEAAEDLTGEVFLRMVKHIPAYRDTGTPFQAWLYRIAHNLVVDHYRKQGSNRDVNLEEAESQPAEANPAQDLDARLTMERVQRALDEMDSAQAEVIRLRFIVGLPIKQVSDSLDKSVASIKALQHRGLKSLRVKLQDR